MKHATCIIPLKKRIQAHIVCFTHRVLYNIIYPTTAVSTIMKNNPIQELDEPSATLRILLLLSNQSPEGITMTTLNESLSEQGVGRTAIDSSRKALLKAGLTVENSMKNSKKRTIIVISSTPLGVEVTKKLNEIQEILNNIH